MLVALQFICSLEKGTRTFNLRSNEPSSNILWPLGEYDYPWGKQTNPKKTKHASVIFFCQKYKVPHFWKQELETYALRVSDTLNQTVWLCCESNTLVPSRFSFFSYATDLSLFLETGKSLTCAVFMESVDLMPEWWIRHYILGSSAELLPGAKRDGFCFSTSQSLWCAK